MIDRISGGSPMGEQVVPWDLIKTQGELASVGAVGMCCCCCYSRTEKLGCWEEKQSEFRFNLRVSDDGEEHFS